MKTINTKENQITLHTKDAIIEEDIKVVFEGGSGGTDTSDATATADDILLDKTAYVNGEKITGTIPTWDGSVDNGVEISGGNVDVVIPPKTVLEGTALPVNGFVEKLYFNTNMSSEEVEFYVSNIVFPRFYNFTNEIKLFGNVNNNDKKGIFYVLYTIDINNSSATIPPTILIVKYEINDNNLNGYVVFNSRILDMDNVREGVALYEYILPGNITPPTFIGWNPDLINPVEVNCENMTSDDVTFADAYYFGESYFDINQIEVPELVSSKEFEEKIVAYGEPIPGEGFVEEIYFNTDMSIDQVKAKIMKYAYDVYSDLFYYEEGNDWLEIGVEYDSRLDIALIDKYGSNNGVDIYEQIFLSRELTEEEKEYFEVENSPTFSGWNPELVNPMKIQSINQLSSVPPIYFETFSEFAAVSPFIKGEHIVSLNSGKYDGSPIDVKENTIINMEKLLEEKRMPLKINVKTPPSKLKAYLDETQDATHLFYNLIASSVDHFIEYDDTKNVYDMRNMFESCGSLIKAPLFDTSNVQFMDGMFYDCINLIEVPLYNTHNVEHTGEMFNNCRSLITIPEFNVSRVYYAYNMFNGCTSLKSILMYGMKKFFDISASTQFEASDLVTIMSNCQVITSTQKLTMGTTNLNKLANVYVKETGVEPYEGITVRPVTICESTDEGAMLATDYFTSTGWTLA